MLLKEIPIKDIKIRKRYREDLGDIDELAESIKLKGLIQPITVNEKLRLLAGERRVKAAKIAGLKTIPAVIRKTEGELDELEIELFENIHRKDNTWQEKVALTTRIHQLMVNKYGEDSWGQRGTAQLLNKSVGSINDAIQLDKAMKIIPELAGEKTADNARRKFKSFAETALIQEAVKEAKEKEKDHGVSRLIIAESNYIIADALAGMKSVNNGIVHFAEVDPPYGIDLKKYRTANSIGIDEYNEIDKKDYPKFILNAAREVYRVLYKDAFCAWWFGPTWHEVVREILRSVGFHVDDIPAIWYKTNSPAISNSPETYLSRSYEPFFVCRKGNPVLRERGRQNVFAVQSVPVKNRIHLTERPVPLTRELLKTFAYPQARVLSPFLGSGNTLISVYKENMTGWGYDLNKEIKKRFLVNISKEFGDE